MKRITILVLSSFILFVFVACNQNSSKQTESEVTVIDNPLLYAEGFKLVNQNCITCHLPETVTENRIAPSLGEIKSSYVNETKSEAQFINQMVDFTLHPKVENSKMPESINKFGIMPILGFSRKQLTEAARYLYHSRVEDPDWYDKNYPKEKEVFLQYTSDDFEDYLKKGQSLALSTKAILGKNLMGAIKTKGTADALEFCNIRAIPLTDSMSMHLNATIKRVSDKNRNPDNVANEDELAYIREAIQEIEEFGKARPKAFETDHHVVGYYPIMTNEMCLQCHGLPKKDIDEQTMARIENLYPDDVAKGYGPQELRGIWVVEMKKLNKF